MSPFPELEDLLAWLLGTAQLGCVTAARARRSK